MKPHKAVSITATDAAARLKEMSYQSSTKLGEASESKPRPLSHRIRIVPHKMDPRVETGALQFVGDSYQGLFLRYDDALLLSCAINDMFSVYFKERAQELSDNTEFKIYKAHLENLNKIIRREVLEIPDESEE